ncbi:MAG TPA: ribonuclease III [Limnochordales bacterium]
MEQNWAVGLEAVLGVPPQPAALFLEAFTHPSFTHEQPAPQPPHNQRLEFLGDAVVGLVVAHELWRRYPHLPEGELTRRRAAVVNSRALADAARRLGLGQWLRVGRGEELTGGRERESALSDLFEAVAGALFIAYGLPVARDFVLKGLEPALVEAGERPVPDFDAKTRLQERLQETSPVVPEYEVLAVEGPPHARVFTVAVHWQGRQLGIGRAGSKKAAEQAAAAEALRRLEAEAQASRDSSEAEPDLGC